MDNEPPNLSSVNCCYSCIYSIFKNVPDPYCGTITSLECEKYNMEVDYNSFCDDYK